MSVRITMTCDSPLEMQPNRSMHGVYCAKSIGDHLSMVIEEPSHDGLTRAMEDLYKMATSSGWREVDGGMICAGCVEFRKRYR